MSKLVAISNPEDPRATPGNGFPTREQVKSAHWRGACPENDMDFDDIYNRGFDAWLQFELNDVRNRNDRFWLLRVQREKARRLAAEEQVNGIRKLLLQLRNNAAEAPEQWQAILDIEQIVWPDEPEKGIFR